MFYFVVAANMALYKWTPKCQAYSKYFKDEAPDGCVSKDCHDDDDDDDDDDNDDDKKIWT